MYLRYVFNALVFLDPQMWQGGFVKALSHWGWLRYLLLGLVDVEANFMIVKAYQYASITRYSLQFHLLGCSLIFENMKHLPTA